MKTRTAFDLIGSALGLALVVGVASAGCCNDVTASQCFDWATSSTCPARDAAAEELDVQEHQVTSDGTFWPAHDYLVDGHRIHEAASCCYDVTRTVCTEELH